MSQHITWRVNSVNRLVKNPEHITTITFPPKPDHYPFASQAIRSYDWRHWNNVRCGHPLWYALKQRKEEASVRWWCSIVKLMFYLVPFFSGLGATVFLLSLQGNIILHSIAFSFQDHFGLSHRTCIFHNKDRLNNCSRKAAAQKTAAWRTAPTKRRCFRGVSTEFWVRPFYAWDSSPHLPVSDRFGNPIDMGTPP